MGNYQIHEFWTDQWIPWLTLIAAGAYMIFGSRQVLAGEISTGTFVATLNVYRDLGERFEKLYDTAMSTVGAIQPLLELTKFLNCPTDVAVRSTILDARRSFATEQIKARGRIDNAWEQIPIQYQDVVIRHLPMKGFSAEAKVGQLIVVHGPTGSGKLSLIKLVDDRFLPATGQVVYSPHLTTLVVGCVPSIFGFMSLLQNLTVGTHEKLLDEKYNFERVRRIFNRIGFPDEHRLMKRLDDDIRCDSTTGKHTRSLDDQSLQSMEDQRWGDNVCGSEMRKISIARALIHTPDILILDRPMDETDEADCLVLMELLREHVTNKGLELSDNNKYSFVDDYSWAPRTVFVTIGENAQCKLLKPFAETVWSNRTVIEDNQKKQVWEKTSNINAMGNN